jgi:hypothetical protein
MMRRFLSALILGALLAISMGTPAAADDGCARALAATAGTPGHAFVSVHCSSQTTTPETPAASPAASAQASVQGCAIGLAAATGTQGEPFVRAACNRLAEQAGGANVPTVTLPTGDNGCATAELMTRGTPGHDWVVATCTQSGDGAAVGERSAAAGCDLAIQAVVGTTAEPFVRAGCAQAVAGSGADTPPATEVPQADSDQDTPTSEGD